MNELIIQDQIRPIGGGLYINPTETVQAVEKWWNETPREVRREQLGTIAGFLLIGVVAATLLASIE